MSHRVGIVVSPKDIPGSKAVLNPAVHFHEKEKIIHLLCRVVKEDGNSEVRHVKLDLNYKIVSIDELPLLVGSNAKEKSGCEDPRITEIDIHLLTYTAVESLNPIITRIGIASSEDFSSCQRLGYFLPEKGNNKDGVFLPSKVDGQYFLYHRIPPNVWIASSYDFENWQNVRPVMFPRPGCWDSKRIGLAIILPSDDGWLAFYHGADTADVYRLGAALFDFDKPWKVIARSHQPLFEPGTRYEKEGIVNNVVFTCGAFQKNGIFGIPYGAADKVIAAAEFTKKEVMNLDPVH